MFGFLLLAALGQCADYNYTNIFQGRWNITMIELDEEGHESPEASVYSVDLTAGEGFTLQGQIFGEDEDGVPAPVSKLGLVMDAEVQDDGKTVFSVQFAPSPDAESLEEIASVKLHNDLDDVVIATGKTVDGIAYSFNIVTVNTIEITLFNKETKAITILRCLKELPPQKGSMMQMLMSFLPMLLMMFTRGKAMQPQAAAGEGKPKND